MDGRSGMIWGGGVNVCVRTENLYGLDGGWTEHTRSSCVMNDCVYVGCLHNDCVKTRFVKNDHVWTD